MSKAFLAVEPGKTALYPQEHKYPEGYKSSRMREQVTALTQTVVTALMRRRACQPHDTPQIQFTMDGKTQPLDAAKLTEMVTEACLDLGADVSPKIVVEQAVRDLYDGISFNEVRRALIL